MAEESRRTVTAASDFNPGLILKEFADAYQNGKLEEKLRQYFADHVMSVFSGRMDSDTNVEERKAKRLLFNILEHFLCDGNPEEVFKQLKDMDHPPQLCGKVFKPGEPTYSCRDCGMDPTCVLCIDCFQHSAHKEHRYRMSTSGGGGYCDCGDQEAWKVEPFCNNHKQVQHDQSKPDPVSVLPPDLRDRAIQLFRCVVGYAVQMLIWDDPESVPEDLQPVNKNNLYTTMLFNDEVHTYDQVIQTLQRAVDCTHKEAIDFATTVDREGRCFVKDGVFSDCNHARAVIERHTARHSSKALKVQVMHSSVLAHQTFAQKILTWLQQVIAQSDGLRMLFCTETMRVPSPEGHSIVETMMLADTKLWKSVRIQTHQLFMAGVLMHPDCKKQFSIIFTKLYPKMMSKFVEDDHDHTVCAVSESVQIFTVPTLAKMLITEHDLLAVILNTFLKECMSKCKKDGKFVFERHDRNGAYKRAYFMLYDLKYALSCRPTEAEWTDKLRENFMNGFLAMLKLLECMQHMDAVTRQTGQHIEFEPEWEGAFNLQLKLSDNLAILLDWCGMDQAVLLEAFKAVLIALPQIKPINTKKLTECTVGGHKTNCVDYDVAAEQVSIHSPVTRVLAGLFTKLHKFGLTPQDVFQLPGVSDVSAAELIEPGLRAIVLVAQTQAGMWRRNGYSLLNQIYFYQNVKCRSEMYDRDIIMIQSGAALMNPNDFIIHLINKFKLLSWAKTDYDDPVEGFHDDMLRQVITLSEEFLNLLIIILSERCTVGVGQVTNEDLIKREIIHQLCIQPLAHSELAKALPENPCHETGIEAVVLEVADFKKPTNTSGKGMYELKPEFYNHFTPYFYHYTKAEQSKAEEAQRKRKKLANEDQSLPPPVQQDFSPGYTSLRHLLDCDIMLYLMKLVLGRMAAKRSRSISEPQFEKILHLIGMALQEERKAHAAGHWEFKFLAKAREGEPSVLSLLEALIQLHNVTHDGGKDLLTWTLKTFLEVRSLRDGTSSSSQSSQSSPASSRHPPTAAEKQEKEKKRKAAVAAKRRDKLMQQMSRMQRNFIKENAELFESTTPEIQPAGSDMDISHPVESSVVFPVSIGPGRSVSSTTGAILEMCILCQESQEIRHHERAMVLAGFIQRSTVLSRCRGKMVDNPDEYDPLFMPSDLVMGPHTSTCGHVMHANCWQSFFDAMLVKEQRRPLRLRHHLSYDIEKMEFLCPLCETLCNTVIPIIPYLPTLIPNSEHGEVELSLHDWMDGIQKTVKSSIKEHRDKESAEEAFLFVPCPLSSITKMMAESVAKNFQLLFDYVYDDASAHFSDSVTEMLRKFSTDVYATGLGVHPDNENSRVPIMAWSTCAYTIMATEHCLRDESRPLFGSLPSRQEDCLSALVRFSAVSSQIFQKDIIRKQCITLLSALVCDSADKRLQHTPCLLDMDMFHYLVSLSLSLPTLYVEGDASLTRLTRIPTGGLNDLHTLKFTFTGHLVQVMLTSEFSAEAEPMDTETDADAERFLEVYKQIIALSGVPPRQQPTAWQLMRHVQHASLPFLRCAALYFYYLTGVRPTQRLKESDAREFVLLCQYLSMPEDLTSLFHQGSIFENMIQSWCRDERVKTRLSAAGKDSVVRYPLSINQLIQLPSDYSELINQVSFFTCPKSDGDDSRVPTMCLGCGKMLCSQSYCCQTELGGSTVGAATTHAHSCGAGTGMFLRVRECQVLLLSGRTKGCCFAPPYLDDYGETDQGLRRGNPLHLCPDRYHDLQRLWLSHGIPEKIAHLFETNTNLLSIEWQHL